MLKKIAYFIIEYGGGKTSGDVVSRLHTYAGSGRALSHEEMVAVLGLAVDATDEQVDAALDKEGIECDIRGRSKSTSKTYVGKLAGDRFP